MVSIAVAFLARCLLVMLFLPFSALDKVLNFDAALEQAAQVVPKRWLARSCLAAGFCVELGMSLLILSGQWDRLGGFVLALYCVATAVLWKRFWAAPQFRLAGPSPARDLFWDFLKNLAVAGGFLMITFAGGANGVGQFLAHPFSSTHPYDFTEIQGG